MDGIVDRKPIKPYVPNFVEKEEETICFGESIKKYILPGHHFEGLVRKDELIIAVYDNGKLWHVVGMMPELAEPCF